MHNPYRWNEPTPDLFFGRHTLADELFGQLSSDNGRPRACFGVIGGRRMGKTTLLTYIHERLQERAAYWAQLNLLTISIYVDLQAIAQPIDDGKIWHYILQRIWERLPKVDGRCPTITDYGAFSNTMKEVVVPLPQRVRIIVLFDEVEKIIAAPWSRGFLDNARSWLSTDKQLSRIFTAVFAGSNHIQILKNNATSPISNILVWRSLRALNYDDACRLMQEPLQTTWPKSFLDRIFAESGGHPMLIQYLMQQVCTVDYQAEALFDTYINKAIEQFHADQMGLFESWWNQHCTPIGQKIYALMARDPTVYASSYFHQFFERPETRAAIEGLLHLGLISEIETGQYHYAGEMFRSWYSDNIAPSLATSTPEASDEYSLLERGLTLMHQQLPMTTLVNYDFFTIEMSLKANIARCRLYGSTHEWNAERVDLIHQLDAVAQATLKVTFTSLCYTQDFK